MSATPRGEKSTQERKRQWAFRSPSGQLVECYLACRGLSWQLEVTFAHQTMVTERYDQCAEALRQAEVMWNWLAGKGWGADGPVAANGFAGS